MSRGWEEMASGFQVGAVIRDRDQRIVHVEGVFLSGEMVLADTGAIQARVWGLIRKAAEAAVEQARKERP